MELTEREWGDIRFSLRQSWTAYLVDNGVFAFGPAGETLALSQRPESVDALAAEWSERLLPAGSRVLSESRSSGPLPGLLRVTAIERPTVRILTQLFVGGPTTVTATYAAPATDSYDRHEADAIIRAIRVKVPTAA